ncbi:MAG TPA: ribbon-helix-helix domain-containing protein [Dongiaceae bacterium]|nr:ribbon-helix-helix domain-containing protein [Dongiaceae bacterium]HVZ00063.1 ribbon-helix-helix domain-containing protein [Dongiaceae bacterium]
MSEATAQRQPAIKLAAIPDPRLIHRVVQYRGRRYSLKLDYSSWNALEQAASRRNMRLNQLVDELAVATNHEGNFSATVRAQCLAELKTQIEDLENKVRMQSMSGEGISASLIADACPAPTFVVDGRSMVQKANQPAQKWLGLAESALVGRPVDQYFQVKSTMTLPQIVEQFGQGKYQVFPARIVCLRPGRLIMAKATICPVLRRSDQDLIYTIMIDVA